VTDNTEIADQLRRAKMDLASARLHVDRLEALWLEEWGRASKAMQECETLRDEAERLRLRVENDAIRLRAAADAGEF
jgi:hypothetical protein